jgi:hypothetical protein
MPQPDAVEPIQIVFGDALGTSDIWASLGSLKAP